MDNFGEYKYEPGFTGRIVPFDIPGFETVFFTVTKTGNGSEAFDDLKNDTAGVLIAKKTGNKLKLIHSFHGSEKQAIIKSGEIIVFKFPHKFFTYFKSTGLTQTQGQREYIISIYPDNLSATECFDFMKHYYVADLQNQEG
jgi:hypothetical protein